MDKKTILFLITKATWGGAQRYVYDLATHIHEYGYTPVLAFGSPGRLSEMLASAQIRTLALPALRRDISIISDIKSFFEIGALLRDIRPAVLHLNSSKAAGIGALAARLQGVPRIVFTVHGWPFKEDRNLLFRAFIYIASFLTALLAHETIVVSKRDFEIGKRMWWARKKITYIPLGREKIDFLSPDEGFRAMFKTPPPLSGDTLRIVSIAELTRNKGLAYAIDCIAELRDRGIDAIFVNPGDGEERAALESRAAERGVSDRVFLPSFIPDAARNLCGFDVFLLPSIKEGTPYVMMEAILAGIPIVATTIVQEDFDAFPQISFVPPADTLALADAIQQIARKPRVEAEDDPFPLRPMIDATARIYG